MQYRPPHDRNILLVGASVRAAAASALRSGYAPWCVDLFADMDLARAHPVRGVPLDQYPGGLIDDLALGPVGPWMYCGGLENHPDLFQRVDRVLWGNSTEIVHAVRDPTRFAKALATFDVPQVNPPSGKQILLKPLRSSGGLDIRQWTPGTAIPDGYYLQEFVGGESASAVFVAIDGKSMLLGATRQLIGCAWLHAERPFQYAGSIGPLVCPNEQVTLLGQTLVDAFSLRGIFGVDFLFDGGQIRPVEANPRYPASLEILERIARRPLLAHHFAAFAEPEPRWLAERSMAVDHHGKAILYAQADLVFPPRGPWDEAFEFALEDLDVPYADIPNPGQRIQRGSPILTFFAKASSSANCEAMLMKIAADLDRALYGR